MRNNITGWQSPSRWCKGWPGDFLSFGFQVILRVFCCWTDLVKRFSQPTYPPCLHGKYTVCVSLDSTVFVSLTVPNGCCSLGCHGCSGWVGLVRFFRLLFQPALKKGRDECNCLIMSSDCSSCKEWLGPKSVSLCNQTLLENNLYWETLAVLIQMNKNIVQRTLSVRDLPSAWGFGSPFHLLGKERWSDFHCVLGHTKNKIKWYIALQSLRVQWLE